MYKTAITLPETIRSRSAAALLAGMVALTTLCMTPLTASAQGAGTTQGAGVTVGEIRHVVDKYLTKHPELLRQAVGVPQGIYVGDSEHQQP